MAIYLDHNATSPMHPEIDLDAAREIFSKDVEASAMKLLELVNKLPALIRQAAG
jgi:cysteine sulfinate desulfinase/cysteine desulfurase-like protein